MPRALGRIGRRRFGGTLRRRFPLGQRRRGPGRQCVSLGRTYDSDPPARTAPTRHRGETMTLPDLDWEKMNGLIPAIVQDESSGAGLMMGYMNREALAATENTGRVTFWSRSKSRLWTKGETSGHFLEVSSISADCDRDALLILAQPAGPACHLGTATCWGADPPQSLAQRVGFLSKLEQIV